MVKLYGASCFISDIFNHKLELAKQYGADAVINAKEVNVGDEIQRLTGSNGATVVIDAVCTEKSFEQALSYVCAAGRVIPLGFNKNPSPISQLSITAREIDIRGSRLHNNRFPKVIDYFINGNLKAAEMITHRFPFQQINDAIALIENPEVHNGKVVMLF
jgi:L-gulonate 5-dehydrogenase